MDVPEARPVGASPESLLARALRSRMARYLAVGVATFAVDLGLLALLYQVVGAPLWLATTGAFWSSVAMNFVLQRAVTFGRAVPATTALWRYAVLLAANSVANVLVIEAFERAGLGYAAGKVVVTAAQTVWTYILYRTWVFAPPRRPRTREGAQPGADATETDGVVGS